MNIDKSTFLKNAIQELLAAHLQDPNMESWNDGVYPAEWLYIQRITERLASFSPNASEELIVAANSQHLFRWEIDRKSFPEGRIGYYQWRTYLSEYQAQKARDIILTAGFDADFADQVKIIVKKENIFTNPEAQTLEDVVCLVFLEFYLDEFVREKSELDMSTIIQKTWNKMSEKGHQEALKIKFSDEALPLIKKALGL
jgi:hypothetical protein